MPLYEMILVAKIGESQGLAQCLKTLSSTILNNGGIVRNFDNLGDRVLVKNLELGGARHNVGRFIKVEFDATPALMRMALD